MMRATWLLIRFSAFRFCNLLDCAFFNARVTARGGCAALALEGWTPPPGGLGLPPASYKTGPKISTTKKSRRSKDLLLLCFLKPHRTIPFSRRRSLWQR